jgi:tRNA-modifying protein YgfZ
MALPFFDLSARTKLRVSGADRVRFLNGQTTNDIRKATAAATQESCVLNA